MALTALAVSRAKQRKKQYKLTDYNGLFLLVTPAGGKYWQMNYRFGGKQKTLSFGKYPQVSLADARKARDKARETLAGGKDPTAVKKLEKLRAQINSDNSFQSVGEEWLAKVEKEGRALPTMKKLKWLLGLAYPVVGDRPIADITAPELLVALRMVEARGRYETARRLRNTCSCVFRYAVATGRAERDVTHDLRGALITPKVKHYAAILNPIEAGGLLRAIEGFEGQPAIAYAMKIAPHLFVRPSELRYAEWAEVDCENAIWTIPETKTKMRREHKVPLSRQTLEMLDELRPMTGDGIFLFPGVRSPLRPVSDNTMNAVLRRLGYDKTQMTAHGFRAMAATLLNEMGIWNPDAIERQLAHQDSNSVRRAYTRGEYWDERVRMMQHWSDYLDQLRDGATILTGSFGSR